MKILITGGCGFLGHHVVEHLLKSTDAEIVIVDRLSYASNGFDRLRDIKAYENPRVRIIATNFTLPFTTGAIKEIGEVEYILHLGAETHVDRSIVSATQFVLSNVLGTQRILDLARKIDSLKLMIYASTDEVYGPAGDGIAYKETDQAHPTNPYAATKLGGEALCLAYANTHKVPVCITNTMNLFGERQHPEKFIPMVIKSTLAGEMVPIHANPDCTKAGSRFYLHCRNYASAVSFLIDNAIVGEKYNVVGEREIDNLQLALFISKIVGRTLLYEMVDFHSSRPGHDLRYALDGGKMERMGWKPTVAFEDSLTKTVKWYLNNPRWLDWS